MVHLTSSGRPISSSATTATDATPLVITTIIPAGSLNLDPGADFQPSFRREFTAGQTSSRFSRIMSDWKEKSLRLAMEVKGSQLGFISLFMIDGTSQRPMSNAEIEQPLTSIEAIIKSGLRISPSDSGSVLSPPSTSVAF